MTIPLTFLGLLALALALHYQPKKRRHAGNEQLRRRHREIQRQQLGERYRDEGHVLPQVLYVIGSVVLLHAVLVSLWFIAVTVMGMSEPRW